MMNVNFTGRIGMKNKKGYGITNCKICGNKTSGDLCGYCRIIMEEWGMIKLETETFIVTKDEEIYVSSSAVDRIICPVCLATNTVVDLNCCNCGYNLK